MNQMVLHPPLSKTWVWVFIVFLALLVCDPVFAITVDGVTSGANAAAGGGPGLGKAIAPLLKLADFLSNKLAVLLAVFAVIAIAVALFFKGGEMTELIKGLVGVVVVACVMVFSLAIVQTFFPDLLKIQESSGVTTTLIALVE